MHARDNRSGAVLSLLASSADNTFSSSSQQQWEQQIELDVLEQFQELWDKCQAGHSVQQQVPQLYTPAPKPGTMKALVQQQVLERQLQSKAAQCLSEEDLSKIELALRELAVPGPAAAAGLDTDDLWVNYDGFTQAATALLSELGAEAAPFFHASVFLKFERDAAGAISLPLLIQYITLRTTSQRSRLQLAAYDESGTGMLDLQQLHRYLSAAVASAPMLAIMEPSFVPHYLQIASRKLLLFHGRRCLSQGRSQGSSNSSSCGRSIRLCDLVNSPVMAELQELLLLGPGADQERDMFNNWFSAQSAQRVLATFTSWDLDGNGALSKSEFSAISQGAMTELFLSRVFEEHVAPQRGAAWPQQQTKAAALGSISNSSSPSRLGPLPSIRVGSSPPPFGCSSPRSQKLGPAISSSNSKTWPPALPTNAAGPRDEMDLLAFADFVLAWDHRNHPAAVGYFFKIFDIRNQGYLTLHDLYTFFKEVHVLWVAMGEYADLDIYDVLDEIMDMVKPAQPGRITKADLETCKVAGTVFSILANVDQFYQYNYRENFMHQDGEDGG